MHNSAGDLDEFGAGDGSGDEASAELQGGDFRDAEREDWENGTEREDFRRHP